MNINKLTIQELKETSKLIKEAIKTYDKENTTTSKPFPVDKESASVSR